MPQLENNKPPEENDGADEDRSRGNLIALLFIALLLAGGYWLFAALEKHREIGDCIASGRRDCVPLTDSGGRSP
jgi:hypothetical protein